MKNNIISINTTKEYSLHVDKLLERGKSIILEWFEKTKTDFKVNTYIYQTKIVENYHYYQVQEIYIHDYDISLKTYMEDYEILDSTPVSITVRSRDWKNEYPELVGKKTDFDIKTIDAENNPLGKDN